MSNQQAGFLPPDSAAGSAVDETPGADVRRQPAAAGIDDSGFKDSDFKDSGLDDSGLLAAADREHLEREIAAIESAAAALRRAEPGLESWTDLPAATMQKPRPIWLLIGVLWLSTAIATIGAAFAISALVG